MQRENYESFMVRVWRIAPDHTLCDDWCGEIEHIQNGMRWRFTSLDELLIFLIELLASPSRVPSHYE